MNRTELLAIGLREPRDSIFATASRELKALFPDKAIQETESHAFDVFEFSFDGKCERTDHSEAHNQWDLGWDHGDKRTTASPYNVWHSIAWEGNELEVLTFGIIGNHCRDMRHYIIGDTVEIAQSFFAAVCEWCSDVRDEILVFSSGSWHKSEELFEAIQNTRLDSLVLPDGQKDAILADFKGFFASEETYGKYGIAWKRGIILLGPPGNGKTHMVKGLINELKLPCLYVRSFKADYSEDQHNIRSVFERARDTSPCILVFEDLDSLLDDGNRSFFLNEMDGFHDNHGVLSVATTNHPERLDPAILNRPSRFDRKYTFDLPELAERGTYLGMSNSQLDKELQMPTAAIEEIAASTDGFSYAYLKELVLSSLMHWISSAQHKDMGSIALEQVGSLREQMATEPEVPEDYEDMDDSMMPPIARSTMAKYARAMARRRR